MPKSSNRCYKCEYFTRYYVNYVAKYFPSDYGFCDKNNKLVKADGDCESFFKKAYRPIKAEEIAFVIDDVKQIEKLLES